MKAVILAAGSGKRIRDTHDLPKGFIMIAGQPLILRSVDLLKAHGISHIILVVGYGAEHYESLFGSDPSVTIVYNDKFVEYESLYSLYIAQYSVEDDFLLLESDIFYESRAIALALQSPADNLTLVAPASCSNDEVFVAMTPNHQLIDMKKDRTLLPQANICGEFVGISKISLSAYAALMVLVQNNTALLHNGHYEEEGLVLMGKTNPVTCLFDQDLLWCEIDNQQQLQAAEALYPRLLQQKCPVLLNPGPVTTSERVKQALKVPDICHREREFTELVQSIRRDLLKVVNADERYTTIPFCASGTGAIEACLSSVVGLDESILIINNGAYGQRMVDIAKRYQINVVEVVSSFDETLPLTMIESRLKDDARIRYVAMVHHETSTGLLNPLAEMGALCRRYDRHFIVDAMSSFAGSDIDLERDGIHYIMASANKCLHGMPGLSFVIANKVSLLATKGNARSYYFDLLRTYHSVEPCGEMPFTPPVQVVYALRQALDDFLLETLAGRIQRYHQLYQQLQTGLRELGFDCVTPAERQSQILMTVRFPKQYQCDFDQLHDRLYGKGYTIYPRKLDIPGTFRLACMGEISAANISRFLTELKAYLADCQPQLANVASLS